MSSNGSEASKAPTVEEKLKESQEYWDGFSQIYEAINKKITILCAQELHRHLDLPNAKNVLEVASGGGIGTQDILTYLAKGTTLKVTDYSPVMLEQAKERLLSNPPDGIPITVESANALDLSEIKSAFVDRYISSLCLQLVPDPDAMLREASRVLQPGGIAGFTIWGREENSGLFTIFQKAAEEIQLTAAMAPHSNFNLQADIDQLRARVKTAGFDQVVIFPFWTILERWNGDAYVDFFLPKMKKLQSTASSEEIQQLDSAMRRIAKEWIDNGKPIGLEVYIILARRE